MAASTRMLNAVISITYEGQEAVNQLNQSLTNTGQIAGRTGGQLNEMGRTTGFLSQQFSIMRRSFEYAVAGMGLYKIYQAIGAWKQYESQLGSLNSTLGTTYNNLQNIGAAAMQVSNQTAQPLSTILQSFQNIAQTYPGISTASMAAFAKVEAQVANILGAQPQDVGSTVGALATAFYSRQQVMGGGGPALIAKIADMLVVAQKEAGLPNVSGEELLTAAQNLTGGAVIGRFSLPQALGYFSVIERQMASPSKASLYLRQLMARIVTPTSKEAAYYSQAGLPSGQALAGMTGNQIIQQLVKAVISQPGSNMNWQQAVNAGFKNVRLGGAGRALLEEAIGGRLQSGIAANLIVQGFGQLGFGQRRGLTEMFAGANVGDLNRRNQYFLSLNRLQQASVEFSNLSTGLLNDLNPVIQNTARFAGEVAGLMLTANSRLNRWSGEIDKALAKIPFIGGPLSKLPTGGLLEAFGIAASAVTIKKMLTSDTVKGFFMDTLRLGRIFGRGAATAEGEGAAEQRLGPTLLKYIRGPIDVKELEAALAGKADGTPMNPFWVVIAPLSMQTAPGLFGGKGPKTPPGGLSFEGLAEKMGMTILNKVAGPVVGGAAAALGYNEIKQKGVRGVLSDVGGWFGDIFSGAKTVAKGATGAMEDLGGSVIKLKPYDWFKKPTDIFTEVIGKIDQEAGELFQYGGGKLSNIERLAKRAGGSVFEQLDESVLKEFEAGLVAAASRSTLSRIGSIFDKLPRFGAKGFRDNALFQILWSLAFPQSTNAALRAPKGMGDLVSGDYGQFVPKNSLAWLAFHPNLVPGAGFGSPLFAAMARAANSPAVQKGLAQFTQHHISLAQFNRLLETAELGQRTRYFATSTPTGLGVVLPESIDATFTLEPTQALSNLLKPVRIRTAVPLKYVNTNAPAPTTRGKKVNRRL